MTYLFKIKKSHYKVIKDSFFKTVNLKFPTLNLEKEQFYRFEKKLFYNSCKTYKSQIAGFDHLILKRTPRRCYQTKTYVFTDDSWNDPIFIIIATNIFVFLLWHVR